MLLQVKHLYSIYDVLNYYAIKIMLMHFNHFLNTIIIGIFADYIHIMEAILTKYDT